MNTPTLIPIKPVAEVGEGSNIVLLQIAVPEGAALCFPACFPRGNYLAAALLREAIIAKLSANPESVRVCGELNKLILLVICDSAPTAPTMNAIRELLAESMALDAFAVISRHCASEGFFREFWRGALAGEIDGMTTFETLNEAVRAEVQTKERLVNELKTMVAHLREYAAVLAAAQPPKE